MDSDAEMHSPALSSGADCLKSLINEYAGNSSSAGTSAGDVDSELMDCLVRDVRRLSETLTELSTALDHPTSATNVDSNDGDGSSQEVDSVWSVNVHQCLCNVLQVLKEAIIRYRFLQSNDIFEYIGALVDVVKGLKFDHDAPENSAALKKAHATLENLQIAVAECVGEYLTWEMTHYESSASKMSWSAEDVSSMSLQNGSMPVAKRREKKELRKQRSVGAESSTRCATSAELLTNSEDRLLNSLDNGVEMALSRARAWSNYCKELLSFIQRRISLESEHARTVQKLNVNASLAISLESYLPLRNIYLSSIKIENDFYDSCVDTMKHLYDYKFIKPLEARKAEADGKRKNLKHTWEKCVKEVETVAVELKKARQNVVLRESGYQKARENVQKSENLKLDSQKIERRRKLQEEAYLRWEQASQEHWLLQQRLEEKYQEMATTKTKILQEVRELIYQCDQTTKACTAAYLQEMANLWTLLPRQYQKLAENVRQYIPGTYYKEFVNKTVMDSSDKNLNSSREQTKASSESELPVIQVNGDPINTRVITHRSSIPSSASSATSTCYRREEDEPSTAHIQQGFAFKMSRPKAKVITRPSLLSDAALSHRLQKVRAPTKCCHCDTYTFFQTVGCTECGLNWHKTCLDSVNVHCSLAKQLKLNHRRTCIFGVPLRKHLEDTHLRAPLVLTACVDELERRGLNVKGLYRVCGVKSSIEQICDRFERQEVELSSVLPTNIASIIKLYLRQLPEPLLTHLLYDRFVDVAKRFPATRRIDEQNACQVIVNDLKRLCDQLPTENYETLKVLCLHLNRVSWFEAENQMSATNLGIVFGPSLLWIEEGLSGATFKSLLDAPLQTRVAELLIKYAYEIFDEDVTQDLERLHVRSRPRPVSGADIGGRRQVRSMDPVTCSVDERNEVNMADKSRKSATPDLLRESKMTGRAKSLQDSLATTLPAEEYSEIADIDGDLEYTLSSSDRSNDGKSFR
ncbi:hypothetical protein M514_02691 [Trichuris suis]|uniref:RhoGAP domain protein n=1 Tax=Trichuris suis TaxID=68888 RepID=A0A085NNR5_9BILA|nr:hypothetical protein M514_02691 [Trichuris suis]